MRRLLHLMLLMLLLIPIEVSLSSQANAAKTGSTCKKLNAKGWDRDNPIVCKKNKSGKLVWTKFKIATAQAPTPTPTPTPTPKPMLTKHKITINLSEINETLPSTDPQAIYYCNIGGRYYKDIGATTGVEIRDGSGNLLATGMLGPATVIDLPGQKVGSCIFAPVLEVVKSDFYQIKVGTRYNKSFSFADLERDKWEIQLYIGS
jgi:hypothetical protein